MHVSAVAHTHIYSDLATDEAVENWEVSETDHPELCLC